MFQNNYSINLDISDYTLKACKLVQKRKGIFLDTIKTVQVPEGSIEKGRIINPEALSGLIRGILRDVMGGRARTQFIHSVLPDNATFVKLIEVDVRDIPEKEVRSRIEQEIAHHIPYEINDIYLDFQRLGKISESDTEEVLVGVCPKAVVDEYTKVINAAGFIPKSLEPEPLAITRAIFKIAKSQSLSNRNVIVVDFGAARSGLIFWREQKYAKCDTIELSISIPLSGREINRVIEENLKLSFEQAELLKTKCGIRDDEECKGVLLKLLKPVLTDLLTRIKQAINFHSTHFKGATTDKILLSGGGSNLKGLDAYLKGEIGVPVEYADPLVNIVNRAALDKEAALSYCTVIGFGLKDFHI